MEILTMPMADALAEAAEPGDAPIEEREMDVLAFELLQKANSPMPAGDDLPDDEEARRGRASCL